MTIKMVSTRQEFVVEDESGYRFHVVATQNDDPSRGWDATVTMTTRGFVAPEHAIGRLGAIAAQFSKMVAGE